jgi:DNA repair exonuclease SbcCD ATPase subunit
VTKILVVLCAGLALLLSALTMAYASNARTIRDGYQQMRDAETAANAAAAEAGAAREQLQRQLTDANQALAAQAEQVKKQIQDLQAKVTEYRTQAAMLQTDLAGKENRNDQLTTTVRVHADELAAYRSEVSSLRGALLKASHNEIALTDRISELESVREVQDQTVRSLQEQLADAQYRLSTATLPGSEVTSAGAFEYNGPTIRARIESVVKHPAGYDIVTISEGTNAGIRENMQLSIIRGDDQFLAKVIVLKADPQESVARVDYLGRKVTAKVGDLVLSRLD